MEILYDCPSKGHSFTYMPISGPLFILHSQATGGQMCTLVTYHSHLTQIRGLSDPRITYSLRLDGWSNAKTPHPHSETPTNTLLIP